MGSVIVRMADHGRFFATRGRMRQIIADRIETLPAREAVIVDWSGVESVTGAVAAEFAAHVLGTPRRIGSRGMNGEVRETYETAVRRLDGGRDVSPPP